MSGLFKSKEVEPKYISTPQDERIKELYNLVSPAIKDYTTNKLGKSYSGDMVAPLTDMENLNLSKLSEYMNSPLASESGLFNLASSSLTKLMGEDPWAKGGAIDYTSKQLKDYLTNELLPQTRQRGASTRSLYSSGYVDEESDQVADVMDKLAQYSYQYQTNLNQMKAGLIPVATGMADYSSNELLNRINNTMGLSGYERTNYTQPKMTAEYNDYIRLINELQGVMGTGVNLAGMSGGTMAYPQYQPSAFSQYVLPTVNAAANVWGAINLGSSDSED
jgi:prophage antirepressor-like protein